MQAYFLSSARLGFRAWQAADAGLAQALWGDPAVTRLIGGPFSSAQVDARLSQEIATGAARGLQYWPFFLRADDTHIGCCGLRPYGAEPQVAELGVHVRAAQWGHGYAHEAARAVIAYAFDTLQLSELFAGHHPHNQASRALLQKLGFRYMRDELYPPTGLLHPSYTLSRAALAASR